MAFGGLEKAGVSRRADRGPARATRPWSAVHPSCHRLRLGNAPAFQSTALFSKGASQTSSTGSVNLLAVHIFSPSKTC